MKTDRICACVHMIVYSGVNDSSSSSSSGDGSSSSSSSSGNRYIYIYIYIEREREIGCRLDVATCLNYHASPGKGKRQVPVSTLDDLLL